MSVATQLGLDDPASEVFTAGRQRWSGWQEQHPVLTVVEGLDDLPAWMMSHRDRSETDAVLLALAELSSPEGGDDVVATGVLAWLLLPGAITIAASLDGVTGQVDELLAAQLWVEARTFPWQRGHRVAANILMNARKAVMRDLGLGAAAERTWAHSELVDAHDILRRSGGSAEAEPSAQAELTDLLDWACARGVLTGEERALLVEVAEAADRFDARGGRGTGGLLGNQVSAEVAQGRGVSPLTIRRRTRRSVDALRQATNFDHRVSA